MNPAILLLFLVPLVEVWLLIKLAHRIGAAPAIALCVVTAVVGGWLLKRQGMSTVRRIQMAQAQGQLPAREMLEGMMLLVAGMMLITPGFLSDAVGFSLLMPNLRARLAGKVLGGMAEARPDLHQPTVIEGESRPAPPPDRDRLN